MTVSVSYRPTPSGPTLRPSSLDARDRRRHMHYANLRRSMAGDVVRLRHRVHAAAAVAVAASGLLAAGVLAAVFSLAPPLTVAGAAVVPMATSWCAWRRCRRARHRLVRAEAALRLAEREAPPVSGR